MSDNYDPEVVFGRIKHAHNQLFEMPLRDIETLLSDALMAMHELRRRVYRQQGKADLQAAIQVADHLKIGSCVTGNHTIHSFGSETIRLLIEEIEWRRKAMKDEHDGNLVGQFDGKFTRSTTERSKT